MNAGSSTAHAESLHMELYDCKMKHQETVNEYGSRLAEMKSKLASIGEPLDDKIIIRSFLRGLPEEFKVQAALVRKSHCTFDEAIS